MRWAIMLLSAPMAVPAVGDASTRGEPDPVTLIATMHGPKFELAAFKGGRLSFRTWDGQLRQPVLLAASRDLIPVCPQPGYLHRVNEFDTPGIDQPETACRD